MLLGGRFAANESHRCATDYVREQRATLKSAPGRDRQGWEPLPAQPVLHARKRHFSGVRRATPTSRSNRALWVFRRTDRDRLDLDQLVVVAQDADAEQRARWVMLAKGLLYDLPGSDEVGLL